MDEKKGKEAYNLGKTQYYLGNINQAIEYFKEALIYLPNDPKVLGALSNCYIKFNDLEQARKYLEDALYSDPLNQKYICNLNLLNKKLKPSNRPTEKHLAKEANLFSTILIVTGFALLIVLLSLYISIGTSITQPFVDKHSLQPSPITTTITPTPSPTSNPGDYLGIYNNTDEKYSIIIPKDWSVKKDMFGDVIISDTSGLATITISSDYNAARYDFEGYIDSIYNEYRSQRGLGYLTGRIKMDLKKESHKISGYDAYIIKKSDYMSTEWDMYINTRNRILNVRYQSPRGEYDVYLTFLTPMFNLVRIED